MPAEEHPKPFSEGFKIAPILLPPRGDGAYVRIPFYERVSPYEDGEGMCALCGDAGTRTVSIELPGEDKKSFCGISHYLEWWVKTCPQDPAWRERTPSDEVLRERLEAIRARLVDARPGIRNGGAQDVVIETLHKLDDLLQLLGCATVDLAYAHLLCFGTPPSAGDNLRALWLALAYIGRGLQEAPSFKFGLYTSTGDVSDLISRYLAGQPPCLRESRWSVILWHFREALRYWRT